MKKSAKSRYKLIEMTNTSLHIKTALHSALKRFSQLRYELEGVPSKPWMLIGEAVERYLESLDPRTGRPKSVPSPGASSAPAGAIPLFHHYVDCDQFADDADLFHAMDESRMLLWAAAPNNQCLHVNPALQSYTGRSAADFLGLGWADSIHPDDRQRVTGIGAEGFRTHMPFEATYRMRRKDGLYCLVADHAHPRFRDGRFVGYVGTMYQIPEPSVTPEIVLIVPDSSGLPPKVDGRASGRDNVWFEAGFALGKRNVVS